MRTDACSQRVLQLLSMYDRLARRLTRRGAAWRSVARNRSGFYADLWREAAANAGAEVQELGQSRMEIRCGGVRLLVSGNLTSLDDPVTLSLAGDKPLVYQLLMERGVPVPRHFVCRFDDWAAARGALSRLGGRCVVKPAHGGWAGNGITTGVSTWAALARALAFAGVFSAEVVLEEQVAGDNYRLLYLDGELLDVVQRVAPALRGDGRSTIRQLLAAENADRLTSGAAAAQTLIPIDADLRHTLRAAGCSLHSVPPAGALVRIKTVINDNRLEANRSANGVLCAAIVAAGASAASALGVRLAGVDVIVSDPSAPLGEAGGVVLEVNTNPGLYFHSAGQAGGARVVTTILERLAGGAT